MIQPGNYDITIQENGDFDLHFQLKDGNGDPVDLTACLIASSIWTNGKSAKLCDFTVAVDDYVEGRFTISLTGEQTGNVLQDSEYDVRVTDANGKSYYWVRGKVNLEIGITE